MQVNEFIRHHYRHFNAATVKDAAEAYRVHVDAGGKMMVTLAGAMSTAELGRTLAPMIRAGLVHAISATGANIEEDIFNLVGNSRYKLQPDWRYLTMADDKHTLEEGYNRVTDTCIPEDVMLDVHAALLRLWQSAERDQRGILRRRRLDAAHARVEQRDHEGDETLGLESHHVVALAAALTVGLAKTPKILFDGSATTNPQFVELPPTPAAFARSTSRPPWRKSTSWASRRAWSRAWLETSMTRCPSPAASASASAIMTPKSSEGRVLARALMKRAASHSSASSPCSTKPPGVKDSASATISPPTRGLSGRAGPGR